MSEAGLEQRLRQAEAAVVKAQAAYDSAHDGSKTLCGQLLLAKGRALEQLMEEKLIQQRTATGAATTNQDGTMHRASAQWIQCPTCPDMSCRFSCHSRRHFC
ncbi:TPA: hypothetical protein ACH3X1_009795 [Trebouxia sp. C0004]